MPNPTVHEADYTKALYNRIADVLSASNTPVAPVTLRAIRRQIQDVVGEIQHRLYQDVLANLTELARQLDHSKARE